MRAFKFVALIAACSLCAVLGMCIGNALPAEIDDECWGGDMDLSQNLDCEEKSCVKDWDKHVADRLEFAEFLDLVFAGCTCETCDCDQEPDDGEEKE